MTSIEELQAQVQIVGKARQTEEQLKVLKSEAYAKWLDDNALLVADVITAEKIKITEEALLRDLTLAIFKETGEKHPAPEVNIREVDKLEYKPENGLYWAIQHNIALKLDQPAFEKIVKASPETFSSFVKIEKIATATIAQNIPAQVEQK